MMDYQLGCGEKECDQEDEKVGQDLLDQQPLPPEQQTKKCKHLIGTGITESIGEPDLDFLAKSVYRNVKKKACKNN
jgi:hypothetical protein